MQVGWMINVIGVSAAPVGRGVALLFRLGEGYPAAASFFLGACLDLCTDMLSEGVLRYACSDPTGGSRGGATYRGAAPSALSRMTRIRVTMADVATPKALRNDTEAGNETHDRRPIG
jgi:hypothetical protein